MCARPASEATDVYCLNGSWPGAADDQCGLIAHSPGNAMEHVRRGGQSCSVTLKVAVYMGGYQRRYRDRPEPVNEAIEEDEE